jgi:hypothetical protein
MKDQSGINYFKNLLSRKISKQDIKIEKIKTYTTEAPKGEFKPKPFLPIKEEVKEIIYNAKKIKSIFILPCGVILTYFTFSPWSHLNSDITNNTYYEFLKLSSFMLLIPAGYICSVLKKNKMSSHSKLRYITSISSLLIVGVSLLNESWSYSKYSFISLFAFVYILSPLAKNGIKNNGLHNTMISFSIFCFLVSLLASYHSYQFNKYKKEFFIDWYLRKKYIPKLKLAEEAKSI